jgi:hypothetical protein
MRCTEAEPELLTTRQLADYLCWPMSRVRRYGSRHLLPGAVLIGDRIFFKRSSIERFVGDDGRPD